MILTSSIKDLCERITSGGTPSRKHPEYFTSSSDGHLWVKSKELLDRSVSDTEEKLTEFGLQNSAAKYLPARTVLIAMYGANVGQLGWLKHPATVNQAVCGLVVDEQVANHRYLFYALLHTRRALSAKAQGAAQQNLNQDLIKNFEIPAPDLNAQRRIASILSAYDDLIENNLQRIKILEEMARNLYHDWFVKFRFPGHEKVRMVESALGEIPHGWEVRSLGELAGQPRDSVKPDAVDPDTPYVGLEHIPRKSITLMNWGSAADVQSTKLVFKRGDILFGKIRPYFHKVVVAPLEGVCSSDTIVVRSRQEEFVTLVLGCTSSIEFVDHATATSQGTKMPRANWDVLVKYQIPVPPSAILGQFNEFASDIVSQLHNFVFRNRILRRTRDLLLPKLISGELDVSGLDIAVPEEVA